LTLEEKSPLFDETAAIRPSEEIEIELCEFASVIYNYLFSTWPVP
jgi:hypothetical protein